MYAGFYYFLVPSIPSSILSIATLLHLFRRNSSSINKQFYPLNVYFALGNVIQTTGWYYLYARGESSCLASQYAFQIGSLHQLIAGVIFLFFVRNMITSDIYIVNWPIYRIKFILCLCGGIIINIISFAKGSARFYCDLVLNNDIDRNAFTRYVLLYSLPTFVLGLIALFFVSSIVRNILKKYMLVFRDLSLRLVFYALIVTVVYLMHMLFLIHTRCQENNDDDNDLCSKLHSAFLNIYAVLVSSFGCIVAREYFIDQFHDDSDNNNHNLVRHKCDMTSNRITNLWDMNSSFELRLTLDSGITSIRELQNALMDESDSNTITSVSQVFR